MSRRAVVVVCFLVPAALAASTAFAAEAGARIEDLEVVALSPVAERAVVRDVLGELHLLKLGDTLPGTAARLVQVLPDRAVAEEPIPGNPQARRKLWVYRERPGGKTRVQVLDPLPPEEPVRSAPLSLSLPVTPASPPSPVHRPDR